MEIEMQTTETPIEEIRANLKASRKRAIARGRVQAYWLVTTATSRHYGGPEEGGWWYDTREIVDVRRVWTIKQGISALSEIRSEFEQPRYGIGSCANNGEPEYQTRVLYSEDDPYWPSESTERPRYE